MRKQARRWSVRFELGPEDPDHVRLHEYLDGLAEKGDESEWIRETLIAALLSKPSGSKIEMKQFKKWLKKLPDGSFSDAISDDETTYEDIDA